LLALIIKLTAEPIGPNFVWYLTWPQGKVHGTSKLEKKKILKNSCFFCCWDCSDSKRKSAEIGKWF